MNSPPLHLNRQEHCPPPIPITSVPPKSVPLQIQEIYKAVKYEHFYDGALQDPICWHIILDESRVYINSPRWRDGPGLLAR